MSEQTIGFIGGGNMAFSLVGGLVADGYDPGRIRVSDPQPARCRLLNERFAVETSGDNGRVVQASNVVVFAVKPQLLREVAAAVAEKTQACKPLVISIVAGVREPDLRRWLGGNVSVVRSMPNTPAMVQSGATALYAGPGVSKAQCNLAESVLRAVGLTLWLQDEQLLDAVTALSGSGPAYFFLVMEALEQAALELGLDTESARILTLQTALGASRMAMEVGVTPAELRARVTSPGGTTERAINVLETAGLRDHFEKALRAARDRSVELSTQLGRG